KTRRSAAPPRPTVPSKHPHPHKFPDRPSSPPGVPTEFRLAQCDLACCRFLRLFELGVGFDPSAASQAPLRPQLAQGSTIYRAWIYLGHHLSRYKGLVRLPTEARHLDISKIVRIVAIPLSLAS